MSRVSHGKCGKSDNGIPCGCHTFYPTDDNTNICSCCTHHKGYHAPPGTEPAPQSLFASGGSQYSGLAASGTLRCSKRCLQMECFVLASRWENDPAPLLR